MPTIKYSDNPNEETAFVTQDDGQRNRVVLTAAVDGTIEYPDNPNSTKVMVTVDGVKRRAVAVANITGGGGGSDQHNLGYYATQAALEEAHPTAVAGDWAIVGATDTVWIWDTDNSEWVDSDQKGQVTSVNGRTGAVTVSEVPSMTGYSGRVLGTDGEVAGWIVPEKVQRSTMPQASEEEAGNIYQYVGPTGVYIDGYFYRCTPITGAPTVTIEQTTGSSLSDLSVDPYAFEDAYTIQHWGPAEGGEVYFTAVVQTGTRWFDSDLPAGVSITGDMDAFFAAKDVAPEEGSVGSIMVIPGVSVSVNVFNPTGQPIPTISTTVAELASYGVTITNPDNVFVFCLFRYCTGPWSGWTLNGSTNTYVDVEEVGISYDGTAVDGDVITCNYTPGQVESYEWFDIKVQDESVTAVNDLTGNIYLSAEDVGATPQYTFMPMADEEHYDHIVQFVGATDANYTNGYFYKCVSDGQDPATYSWEEVEVQPIPEVIKVNTTATLAVADWSSSTQTVTVSGVKADSVVFVSPAPASASDYASAGILCTAQAANSLTFTCTTTPSNAITVNVVCM